MIFWGAWPLGQPGVVMTKLASATPPRLSKRQALTQLGVFGLAGVLSACGFELRKAPAYPFKTLFTGIPEASVFGQELKRNIAASGRVEVITDPRDIERADVIFDLLAELPEKLILSRTSTGAVREFQLRLRVRFRLRTREGYELIPDTEIVQEREISFNESAALSKETEEQLLYRDMRSDLVQQILRRLGALRQL
jgi:LPS-assembly lipoprotein